MSMKTKLVKLELPDESAIEALTREELLSLAKEWRQKINQYQGILFRIKRRIFGKKSERLKGEIKGSDSSKEPAPRGDTTKLPSHRYPEAPVQEDDIDFIQPPVCPCCGKLMQDSGMTEDSEYLDVDTKEFTVVKQKRHKHRCSKCHGAIATVPAPPRVIPGGSYSDNLIVDATLSKYCDLIPMERYSQIAGRAGFPGLPPHSLIQASFKLADFLNVIYLLIRDEVLSARVLLADETTHRMLEGDAKTRWYLWGFSCNIACFFECHDTRSGDVSTEVLNLSSAAILLSDAYSGYKKSLKVTNEIRKKAGKPLIMTAYCNAHARREFHNNILADSPSIDAKFMVDQYKKIYELNAQSKDLSPKEVLKIRETMKPHFEKMKEESLGKIDSYSSKSGMGTAYGYFINNYEGLTLFLSHPDVAIDNNASERLLRSHVVGRKTWYGTHSPEGARTAAVHFTIVETCKLIGVNPREYYQDAINRIHSHDKPVTPWQYKQESKGNTG